MLNELWVVVIPERRSDDGGGYYDIDEAYVIGVFTDQATAAAVTKRHRRAQVARVEIDKEGFYDLVHGGGILREGVRG